MNWIELKSDFKPDGALRDIYVLGTTAADWQRVLDRLRTWDPLPQLLLGGEPATIPQQVEEIFAAAREKGAMLSVWVGGGSLNCHFFGEDDIELDLDPRNVTERAHVEALIDFMRTIGSTTEKAVLLTMENSPELVILRYDPGRDEMEWVRPSSRHRAAK